MRDVLVRRHRRANSRNRAAGRKATMLGVVLGIAGLVIVLAGVFLALLVSGFIEKHTPIFNWIDQAPLWRGRPVLKGIGPGFHSEPWGYTFEQLRALDLTGQTVLITGANSGLGYWSALHLARQNATVVVVCRTLKKSHAAAAEIQKVTGKAVETMECDLSSLKSVKKFTEEVTEKFESIDSLLLNAGVANIPFRLTQDGIEMQMGVNHFAHFLITQELLPLVEAAAEKRGSATIVSVSSSAHYFSYSGGILPSFEAMNSKKGYSDETAYAQSKLANLLFTIELAERLEDKGVYVNALHPGAVVTPVAINSVANSLSFLHPRLLEMIQNFLTSISWSPEDAALTQLYLAVAEEVREEKITGKYFHPVCRETEPDRYARNKSLRKRLWKLSEEVVASKL